MVPRVSLVVRTVLRSLVSLSLCLSPFLGLPFALQFFDGFEEMPLLISYTIEPEKLLSLLVSSSHLAARTMPRAISLTFLTVGLLGFLIVVGGGGSAKPTELLNSKAPLMLAIDKLYGEGSVFAEIIGVVVVLGLFVNFFSFVIYSSQQVPLSPLLSSSSYPHRSTRSQRQVNSLLS